MSLTTSPWRLGAPLFPNLNVAAVLLFCALLFPFVLNYHRYPIPSFYQEWLAIFLAMAATILVAAGQQGERFDWPFAALIPLALLPSVTIHYAFGNALIVHGPPLHLIYLGSAVLLMILGRRLAPAANAIPLADVMAAAFVAGALLSSVASWHWRFQTGVFATMSWQIDAGWIAQRNQNALHIWLGVLGICHFALNRKVASWYFVVGLGILAEMAIFTGSRSVYLYAGAGLALGIWAATRSTSRDLRRRLLLVAIGPVILLGAVQGTRSMLGIHGDPALGPSAIERYAPATVAGDARLGLWLGAAQVTLANPWIGAGPGSFIRESWLGSEALPDTVTTDIPATHAHNLLLQIGAELGIPTVLALAGLIGAWLVFALRQADWQGQWLHVAIPLVVLAHNQVEYSLWYLYFLVPMALAMGAATRQTAGRGIPAPAVLVAAILGLGLAARLGQDYQAVEEAYANGRAGRGDLGQLLVAAGHPVFGAWASTEIAGNSWPSGITPRELDEHATRALFVSPLKKDTLLRHAEALVREGKAAAAAIEQRIIRRVFRN